MPRLTQRQYCENQRFLRDIWLHEDPRIARLSASNQLVLSEYYGITIEIHPLNFRDSVSTPSLASAAGKAMRLVHAKGTTQDSHLRINRLNTYR